jgi:ATP-dependent Lon protease
MFLAYLVAKKVLKRKDPENQFFDRSHVRIQFSDYVIGDSAGTSLVSVFLSLALNLPIRGIAMTGAISLKEKVLPVGGIKDKVGF